MHTTQNTSVRWSIRCAVVTIATAMSAVGLCAQQVPERQPAAELLHSWSLDSKAGSKKKWTFDVTPYVWATRIKGTVGVRDRTADINVSFRKILEHLDAAIMLPAEVWYGRMGVGAEVIWTKVSGEDATPGPLFSDASVELRQLMVDISPRFRVIGAGPGTLVSAANNKDGNDDGNPGGKNGKFALDALVGIRYWKLNNELTLTTGALPGIEIELDRSWGDPYVGARGFYQISNRWGLQARGDVGGFDVGSKFAWQGLGAVSYRIGSWGTVRLGWREIHVDYEYEPTGFIYDVGIRGPILGLTLGN